MDRLEAWKIINEIETATDGNEKLNMAAMGNEYVDTYHFNYLWYKPKNQNEIDAINKYYCVYFTDKNINSWIGIITEMNVNEYYDNNNLLNSYEALDIRCAMTNTITFWEALGYDISINLKKQIPEEYSNENTTTQIYTDEVIFQYACSGDITELNKYYAGTEFRGLNIRYKKFGEENSLIMGAFRNKQYDTVDWLIRHGARLTYKEQNEINDKYNEMRILEKLQTVN